MCGWAGVRVGGCAGGRVGSLFGRAGGMGGGVLSPPWAGGDGRRENSHHTLLLMGAEVALRWAVVFQSLRSGSRFRSCFAAGSFRVFIPSRWFLVSLELLGFFLIKCWFQKKECLPPRILPDAPIPAYVGTDPVEEGRVRRRLRQWQLT